MKFDNRKLIIFDLDGTLINSIPDLAAAVNAMLSHYNLPTFKEEKISAWVGNGVTKLLERAIDASAENSETIPFDEAEKWYKNYYRDHVCEKTYLYPEVSETLEYLQNKGYKMAICTNKPYEYIAPILEKLNIQKYIEMWVGEDSLPEKKPKALPLLHLAEKIDVSVKDSVMVGDSKNDILAADNAKMDSIGVSYGYNYNEDISKYNPTFVIQKFNELKDIL